ncbi:MAG: CoA pyrophosphatase [Flavobacteriales bacterium]
MTHLTASELLSGLRHGLAHELPGHAGFLSMAGWRTAAIEEARKRDGVPRESAVMILLHPADGTLRTTLIVRPRYDGVHSGQVAFPGGRREQDDKDLEATALREMEEEIGVGATGLKVIGALSTVYIPPSRSLVTPFVGHLASPPVYLPDPREVAQVFDASMEELLDPAAIGYTQRYIDIVRSEASVPCFNLGGHEVWGATAMMLWELRELLLRLR